MGKLALVSAKYIIHAQITVEGIVEKPDIVGAIFGQTEGLLGQDLELRELQRNGKIGRIDINTTVKNGKTQGEITIPSNLDKTETALISAILETIEKIGPCNSKVLASKIEDVRTSKRDLIKQRAKELLKDLTYNVLPDSMEITEEVANSVKVDEVVEYGKEKLSAGPIIDKSKEIILVEGRADVVNLLRNGIKNCISMNGTSIPSTIKKLSKEKDIIVFVDGDRGGDLIIKELMVGCDINYIAKAPDGKEVEELANKEINQCLRGKKTLEEFKKGTNGRKKTIVEKPTKPYVRTSRINTRKPYIEAKRTIRPKTIRIPKKEVETYNKMLGELVGTRGAYILDKDLSILGKVPTSELATTLKSLGSDIYAVVFDGVIDFELTKISERVKVKYLIAMDITTNRNLTRVNILTKSDLS